MKCIAFLTAIFISSFYVTIVGTCEFSVARKSHTSCKLKRLRIEFKKPLFARTSRFESGLWNFFRNASAE